MIALDRAAFARKWRFLRINLFGKGRSIARFFELIFIDMLFWRFDS